MPGVSSQVPLYGHALTDPDPPALAGMDVRHRLEAYDDDDVLVAYFHHLWPPPSRPS